MLDRGFTLIEMMLSLAVMAIVTGVLAGLSLGIGRTASTQRATITATEEARRAMETLVARVRAASVLTVNTASLPGDVLRFRPATDINGNGTAVDVNGRLELGPQVTVQPDTADVNADGITVRQLVMTQGNTTRVLCNTLPPDSAKKTNGVPLVPGFWVAARNGGLDITIQAEARDNRGRPFRVALTEFVAARNP
jgi:prepilin-type N-terminal cleavage/methylation domain-containing protein